MPPFNQGPTSSPQVAVEKLKFDIITFDPSKYDRIEDMPEEAKPYFVSLSDDGGGFVRKSAFDIYQAAGDRADAMQEHENKNKFFISRTFSWMTKLLKIENQDERRRLILDYLAGEVKKSGYSFFHSVELHSNKELVKQEFAPTIEEVSQSTIETLDLMLTEMEEKLTGPCRKVLEKEGHTGVIYYHRCRDAHNCYNLFGTIDGVKIDVHRDYGLKGDAHRDRGTFSGHLIDNDGNEVQIDNNDSDMTALLEKYIKISVRYEDIGDYRRNIEFIKSDIKNLEVVDRDRLPDGLKLAVLEFNNVVKAREAKFSRIEKSIEASDESLKQFTVNSENKKRILSKLS